MNDVFFILLLVNFCLLLLGLFSPKTSLFWTKTNQTRGKSILIYSLTTIILFVAFGETSGTKIRLTDHFNTKRPISLVVTDYKGSEVKTTIEPNSEKYKNFVTWTETNISDWESTPASYLNSISITQDNFHLIYSKEGYVVVNFTDKEGKGNQYKSKITQGDLDFLLN